MEVIGVGVQEISEEDVTDSEKKRSREYKMIESSVDFIVAWGWTFA